MAARLFGSCPRPWSSKRSIGASTTFGGSKRERDGPLGFDTRAGMYSNQAWFAPTLLVFEDHPAVGVLGTLVHVLAAHERELHRAAVVVARRRDGAAHAAAVPLLVGEPVPVDARRPEAAHESAAGPVRFRGDRGRGRRDDVTERLVFGHLDGQAGRGRRIRVGAPRPQE